jgi:hypothetical protein
MDLIDAILDNLNDPLNSPTFHSIFSRISKSSLLITLYGSDPENMIAHIISDRAINQKMTADRITEFVLGRLFRPETNPKFNVHLYLERQILFENLRKKYGENIKLTEFEKIYNNLDQKFIHAEIDGAIYLHLQNHSPTTKAHRKSTANIKQHHLIEMKLFTCPKEDPIKSLNKHLQDHALKEFFLIRDILGMMSFSYLHRVGETDVLAPNDKVLQGKKLPPFWAIHLILMDRRIVDELNDAPSRSKRILAAIHEHQQKIPHGLNPKEYIYELISNILKVVSMTQVIARLENDLEEARQREEKALQQVKAERKAKEAERKAKEAERKAKEAERKAKEAYRQKLIDHGISPDD